MIHRKKPVLGYLCWVLVFILLFSWIPMIPAAADGLESEEITALSEEEPTEPVKLTLEELMEKFPDGKYWNGGDPDKWTEKPCTHHGNCNRYGWTGWCGCNSFNGQSIQCMGFADKLGYDATGLSPRESGKGWKEVHSTSALNTLKAGDIVRRNGHSMYVTAVDGETVIVADCNSLDRSCNIRWNVVKTKSDFYRNFEYVRVAPEELAVGYRGKCQKFLSVGTVTLEQESVLMSHPCTAEVHDKAVEIAVLSAGTSLNVTGIYKNTVAEYWYEVSWEEQSGYFPAEKAGNYSVDLQGVEVTAVSAPQNTRKGSGFPIKGTVSSATLPMTRIGAYIYEGEQVSDSPYMSSVAENLSVHSYSIYGSTVDNNLTFGKLPLGVYTYLLTATVTNCRVSEGELVMENVIVRLHQNTFTVSKSLPCSHSYTEELTAAANCAADGTLTYTCKKCGYAYKQTVFAIGGYDQQHQYGNWNISVPATMTAAGEKTKSCTKCGDVVREEISVLAGEVEEWGLILDGELRVNFRMRLQADANVVVTVAEETYNYDGATAVYGGEGDIYQLSVPVAAAQMTDTIGVQICNGEEVSVQQTYSIVEYARKILEDESKSDSHDLIRAMLHYGAAAQVYFDYHTENPANAGIEEIAAAEIPANWEQAVSVTGSADGITFYGATLMFRDVIAVRYYFTVAEDITGFTFKSGDAELTPQQNDDLWYVELPGVLIQDLDASVSVTVNDTMTVSYCPMNYIVRMNQKGSENAKALMQAMYHYYLTAKAYTAA